MKKAKLNFDMVADTPMAAPLSAEEKIARLRLIRSENVGPMTFFQLLRRCGSAQEALDALPQLAGRAGRRDIKVCPRATAEKEMDALQKAGGHLLFWGEADYPALLRHLPDAPPVVFVLGNPSLLSTRTVAVVGARNASVNGRRFAGVLASDLGARGFTVVSGLARGIDAAAHTAALDTGTVAVLAGSVDNIYPPEHHALYHEIRARGALVSEMPMGTEPQARHFPRRNRIIAGLALGTIVVEAALQSGSLITARLAAEQGRDVFAVPGNPIDPRAQGPNKLIRDGAHLIQSADDVLEHLNLHPRRVEDIPANDYLFETAAPESNAVDSPAPDTSPATMPDTLLHALSASPTQVNDVIRASGHPAGLVLSLLLELELAGKIDRHAGNKVSLRMAP